LDEVGHSQKVLGYSAGPDIPAMIWLDFLLARGSPQHEAAEGSMRGALRGYSLTEARERVVSRYKPGSPSRYTATVTLTFPVLTLVAT